MIGSVLDQFLDDESPIEPVKTDTSKPAEPGPLALSAAAAKN
jgi:hypothetical protein